MIFVIALLFALSPIKIDNFFILINKSKSKKPILKDYKIKKKMINEHLTDLRSQPIFKIIVFFEHYDMGLYKDEITF
jgi:hypothetical protein